MKLACSLAQRTFALNMTAHAPITAAIDAPPVSEAVIDAAMEALRRGETHYTDRPGILPLRQLVSARLKRDFNVDIAAKDITITCGVTEARFVALKLLLPADGTLLNASPALGEVNDIGRLIGAMAADSPFARIDVMYTTLRTAGSEIPATLNPPTAWIIWDTSVVGNPSFQPFRAYPDNASRVVVIGGLDNVLPGWRVGWLAGSEVAEKLRSLKQSLTICTTSVSQWAAVELMNTDGTS